MKLETIKLVHGVLTLRRFTPKQLSRKTTVKAGTVTSWLSRNRHRFEVEAPGSVVRNPILGAKARSKGRPARTWTLRDDAAEQLSSELAGVPLALQDEALDVDLDVVASVEGGIKQASDAFSFYRRANDALLRRDAWNWFASLEKSLFVSVQRMTIAGRDIGEDNHALLGWLHGHANLGFEEEHADVSGAVMRVADRVWDEVSGATKFTNYLLRLEDLVADCNVTPAIGSLGILAAIGASSRIHPGKYALAALEAAAREIPANVYGDGFRDLFSDSLSGEPAEQAVPAVLEGAAQHRRVLYDRKVGLVLESIDFDALVRPSVSNAYMKCRLQMPGANINHMKPWVLIEGTALKTTKSVRRRSRAATKAPSRVAWDDLYRVYEEIAENAVVYGDRIVRNAGLDLHDPFAAFEARFMMTFKNAEEHDALHG